MMERAKGCLDNGKIIIAKRLKDKFRIYHGPIRPFVEGRGQLPKNGNGDYQFDLAFRNEEMSIRQLPKATFTPVGETAYSDKEKQSDKRIHKVTSQFEKLSPDQRVELLQELISSTQNGGE